MSKILNVTFRDFRVFNGETKFDFENSQHDACDLICIFGHNGLGKTSFFDGIEWLVDGEIKRLKNIKASQKSSFKEKVLQNRLSNSDNGSVSVTFTNGKKVTRKTKKNMKDNGDYNKGSLTPKKDLVIDSKSILPNDMISSFISAVKPVDRYTEWGGFLDDDIKQREILNSVYLVKRKLELLLSDSEQEYVELSERMNSLDIGEEVKEELNGFIASYNSIKLNSNELILNICRAENGRLRLPDSISLTDKKNENIMLMDSTKNDVEELEDLLSKYTIFTLQLKNIEVEGKKIKSLEEEIRKINLKLQLTVNKKDSQSRIKQIKLDTTQRLTSLIEQNSSFIKDERDKYKSFEENKEKYVKRINNLANDESVCLKLDKTLTSDLINSEEKKKNLNSDIEHLKSILLNNHNQLDDCFNASDRIYIAEDKNLNESFGNLKDIESKIKNEWTLYKEMELKYEENLKGFDDISNSINDILSHIKMEDSNACPVCKTIFSSSQELISKIDLRGKEQELNQEKTRLQEYYSNIKLEEDKMKNGINTWNLLCNEKRDHLLIAYKEVNSKRIEALLKENNEKKNEIKNKKMKIIDELSKCFEYKDELDTEQFDVWYSEYDNEHIRKINGLNRKNREIESLLEKIWVNTLQDIKATISVLKNEILESQIVEEIGLVNSISKDIENYDVKLESLKETSTEKLNEIESDLCISRSNKKNDEESTNKYQEKYIKLIDNEDIITGKIINSIDNYKETIANLETSNNLLNKITTRLIVNNYETKFDTLLEKVNSIDTQKLEYSKGLEKFTEIYENMKSEMEENINRIFGGKSMDKIYKRIEPYKAFDELNYEIQFNDDDKPELYVKGKDSVSGTEILPELFYSTAQLNLVALSVFIGKAISRVDGVNKTIFIDDPIVSLDDINALAFVDLVRTIVEDGEWQIVLSTHNESLFNLFNKKISREYYNSKFIRFASRGEIVSN